jgi:hypothetical protein
MYCLPTTATTVDVPAKLVLDLTKPVVCGTEEDAFTPSTDAGSDGSTEDLDFECGSDCSDYASEEDFPVMPHTLETLRLVLRRPSFLEPINETVEASIADIASSSQNSDLWLPAKVSASPVVLKGRKCKTPSTDDPIKKRPLFRDALPDSVDEFEPMKMQVNSFFQEDSFGSAIRQILRPQRTSRRSY